MDCVNRQSKGASYRWLDKHHRLHASHGPIDLIVQADGLEVERRLAFEQAAAFFDTVLVDLVAELDQLRMAFTDVASTHFQSVVAQHMHASVQPYKNEFVTPMVAVAGSVADCTLAAMCHGRNLTRAFVNNGGDIALHLSDNSHYSVGICENPQTAKHDANAQIDHVSVIRGIATSGWHGRSHSLGIADAVTVLASNSATADAAATLIANRIDLPGSAKIQRVAANALAPDSDLGDRPVTVGVYSLTLDEKRRALSSGQQYAQSLVARGLIESAFLSLQGLRIVAGQNPNIEWKKTA